MAQPLHPAGRANGAENPVSTALKPLEEAAAVVFQQRARRLPDDYLYALQEAIPHLSHSALHRLFQRRGISRLPAEATAKRVQETIETLSALRESEKASAQGRVFAHEHVVQRFRSWRRK